MKKSRWRQGNSDAPRAHTHTHSPIGAKRKVFSGRSQEADYAGPRKFNQRSLASQTAVFVDPVAFSTVPWNEAAALERKMKGGPT